MLTNDMAEGQSRPKLNSTNKDAHLIMSTRFQVIVYQWLKAIQYWLLPPTSIVCMKAGNQARDLCLDCEMSLLRIERPCKSCGLPLPPGNYLSTSCGTCLAFPPHFRRLIAPYRYIPPVSSLVASYKYNRKLVNGRVLSQQFSKHLHMQYQADNFPVLLIPMPLHPARLRQRGFNQANEIARYLGRDLDIPVSRNLVKRSKKTVQQTGLNARERARNVNAAFEIKQGFRFDPETSVAIIDDVVTTGSTVSELAECLLKAGAREVHVWALARTVA